MLFSFQISFYHLTNVIYSCFFIKVFKYFTIESSFLRFLTSRILSKYNTAKDENFLKMIYYLLINFAESFSSSRLVIS